MSKTTNCHHEKSYLYLRILEGQNWCSWNTNESSTEDCYLVTTHSQLNKPKFYIYLFFYLIKIQNNLNLKLNKSLLKYIYIFHYFSSFYHDQQILWYRINENIFCVDVFICLTITFSKWLLLMINFDFKLKWYQSYQLWNKISNKIANYSEASTIIFELTGSKQEINYLLKFSILPILEKKYIHQKGDNYINQLLKFSWQAVIIIAIYTS